MKRLYYENLIAAGLLACSLLSARTDQTAHDIPEKEACLNVLNSLRSTEAKGPLVWNDRLAQAAKVQAGNILEANAFSHTDVYGKTVSERVSETGYNWQSLGENLAIGDGVYDVFYYWKASPSHNEVMYDPKFQECGVGRVRKGNKVSWVLVLGKPRKG